MAELCASELTSPSRRARQLDPRSITGRDTVTGKPGLDMFYNITPSMKLSATVNTDFGETEVDARQINLSRFSLFFPEKRTFFLEDAGVFTFSNTSVSAPAFLAALPVGLASDDDEAEGGGA